jgi:septum formation protein
VRLILASASPRRQALLGQIGVTVDTIEPADIDESPHHQEKPADYAVRMAAEKAGAIGKRHNDALILAADTVVAAGRRILPKPAGADAARAGLTLLSGRRHRVYSAISLIGPDGRIRQRLSTSIVAFKRLSPADIDGYLETDEWRDKAGGYAIQGRAEAWVRHLSGSYSGVVGLPLFETRALLVSAGYFHG